ncbi:hypothetical protein WZ342_2075 [Enterococcus faecalis]|nr:hypothetical protein WZ342_2075 [Enterococcus faecalis]
MTLVEKSIPIWKALSASFSLYQQIINQNNNGKPNKKHTNHASSKKHK